MVGSLRPSRSAMCSVSEGLSFIGSALQLLHLWSHGEGGGSGRTWKSALPDAYRSVVTRNRWSPEAKVVGVLVAPGAADRLIMEGRHQGRQTAAWPQ